MGKIDKENRIISVSTAVSPKASAKQRQFIENYEPHLGYSNEFKRECLKMYVNGMGFRAIERVKGVHHTTVITWVREVGELLPDTYEPEAIPQVGELDELEMRNALARKRLNSIQVNGRAFIGHKKTRFGSGRQ
ncbi:IS1 transposase (plasmid) [Stanieria sp. NIES-3757]|nr:IS1 transposase [Stanieria sp. NIES-3757]